MRIGIDATCWANARGYGRYAREIVRAMVSAAPHDEFICLHDERSDAVFDLEASNLHTVVVTQDRSPTEAAVAQGNRSPRDMLRFTRALWREGPDVFFSPSVYTFFPLPPRQRAVIAIHDAIAERFPDKTLPTRKDRLFWRLKVGLAVRQANLVLTVSEYAKQELVQRLGLRERDIRVAVEAPAAAFRPESDQGVIRHAAEQVGLPHGASWFTYVGGFNPHKNVPAILRALARLSTDEEGAEPHLVLVGSARSEGFHDELETIRRVIVEEGLERRVHWAGYLADEDLRSILSGSLALVLISESEGFGLPGIEAAACGCPVIATRESPLPDLLEGGGWFVEPADVTQTFEAMACALHSPEERRRRGTVARAKAEELAWPRAANDALAALREVVG